MIVKRTGRKGDRSNLCEAPSGPFRQIGPVPFFPVKCTRGRKTHYGNLGFVFVLLLVGIVVLGFYRGWFQFSTNGTESRTTVQATITVDQDKIHEDEQGQNKVQGFGQEAKTKTGDQAGKVEEPERRP